MQYLWMVRRRFSALYSSCKIDYDEELKKLLDDCNDFERHVLSEMLVNTKRSIRSNLLLLNRKK